MFSLLASLAAVSALRFLICSSISSLPPLQAASDNRNAAVIPTVRDICSSEWPDATMAAMSAHAEAQQAHDQRPEVGTRVLAFHPVARAWRPATVASVVRDGEVRVFFVGYAIDEGSGQAGGPSEYVVKIPEELERLEAAGDFLGESGESERGKAWRGILLSLAVADPRVYGERRAAAN